MSADPDFDKREVRRSFERAAATYDEGALLQNEICRRLLGRLDYIKLAPDWIVDAGSGTGNAIPGLLARFPRAGVVAVDLALAMARRIVRETSAREMARVAARVLTLGTVDEIEAFLHHTFDKRISEVPTR